MSEKIPKGWKRVKLGEYIMVKHGYAFKGKYITNEETDAILVTPGNFKIGGGFKSSKFKYYNYEYSKEYILKEGDIVVTMTDLSKDSDTLGYSAKIPSIGNKVLLHNQRIGLVEFKNNEVSKEFIYWLMRTPEYHWYCVSSASGTSIMHTSPSRIENYEFYLPPLPEQKDIASVLSSLDDKIDLLHRQNQTLEKMAETIFRQWFIEEAKEDWEVDKLKNYIAVVDNRGKTPPYTYDKTPYPVIEVNALGKVDRLVDYSVIRKYVDIETFENWFRNKPKKYDTLLSTVGSIGAMSMYVLEIGNIAQNVVGLTAKNISSFYLYQFLKYKINEILQLDIGGVQPSIKVPHLLSIEIVIPHSSKQKEFDNHIKKYVDKMETNYQQIRTLEKLRDTLLPKLMSGKVRVKF